MLEPVKANLGKCEFLLNSLSSVFETVTLINILNGKFVAFKIFKKLHVQISIRKIVFIAR